MKRAKRLSETDPRWKPHLRGLRGDIYCSPACGGNCTKAAHDAAVLAAAALANRLGPGWKPVVSENLGWHWRATYADAIVIHHFGRNNFGAFLWCWHESATTPEKALAAVLKTATEHAEKVAGLIQILQRGITAGRKRR